MWTRSFSRVNYRSVMAFGNASMVEDLAEKLAAMDSFLNRFYPGRLKLMRPATAQKIKATTFVGMAIESASGKIRNEPVHDEEDDYAVPAWTASLPIRQVLGDIEECPWQMAGIAKPTEMAGFAAGRNLDQVILESYRTLYLEEGNRWFEQRYVRDGWLKVGLLAYAASAACRPAM